MKISSWSIINNEKDYIQDVIDYHIKWLDSMYILDTGSNDGTVDILKELSLKYKNLYIEEYHTKYITQYDKTWETMSNPFPEVEVRNFAIDRAEKVLKPDWLIQLDGDEIFLKETRSIIENVPININVIGHSTINPVEDLRKHSIENRQNNILYDPHARIWKPNLGIKYLKNPSLNGAQYHCIPSFNNRHLYHSPFIKFINNPIHFHLHWMYGKKVDLFFKGKLREEIINEQTLNIYSNLVPAVFWLRRDEWKTNHKRFIINDSVIDKLKNELL